MYYYLGNKTNINDSYGHKKGNYVLKEFSNILKIALRDKDIVARLGGGEFILLCPNEKVIPTKLIFDRIEIILCELSEKIGLEISVSIGKSVYPDDTDTLDNLIKLADKKMYKNKYLNKKRALARSPPHIRFIVLS